MSDFSSYREKVARYGREASDAEAAKNYEYAFECYTKALEIFNHMIKCKFLVQTFR